MTGDNPKAPPRLLLRWEALPAQTQIMITFPALVVLLFLVHIGPLNQPLGRGAFYAVFWAILGTFAVVVATRTEAAKRRKAEEEARDDV
ncbi:MAG TPA: hypothetical protein VFQ71_04980 [Gaiellales bacterium]|nr:hypothetical protein [Gaiellales bacterium]